MNQQLEPDNFPGSDVNKKLFRNKRWLVISLIIIFWPVGFYLLYKSEIFKKNTKIILTSVFIFGLAFVVLDKQEYKAQPTLPPELRYTITSDEHKANIKRMVEVELPSRTDEKTLGAIARKIFSTASDQYERTFIAYRIAGDSNRGYWATTHFDPDLEIKILGSSDQDHDALKAAPQPEGEIIGAWLVNWGGEYKMTAYMKDGAVYVQQYFADNSSSNTPFEMDGVDTMIKLQDEGGKERGEYFLINKDGNLEFWSTNGNFYTAPKI